MDNYRYFDQLRTNDLSVIRHGWFSPWYELSDGLFMYGKLYYQGWLRRTAVLESAGNNWTITRKGGFSRTLLISHANNSTIGEITFETWSRNVKISIQGAFEATFTTKRVFSRTFTLMNDRFGDIFNMQQKMWSIKKPMVITFIPSQLKTIPDLPMLMLTSVYLVLLRQQQAAAAAH